MPVSAFAARRALQNPSQNTSNLLQPLIDAANKRRKTSSSAVLNPALEIEDAHDPFEESEIHSDHPVSPGASLLQPPTILNSHILEIDWSSDSSDSSWKPESLEKDVALHESGIDGGSGVEVGSSSPEPELLSHAKIPANQLCTFVPSNDNVLENTAKELTILLNDDESLTLVGTYDLWVRKGAIVIQGATLHPSSQAHRVYAPSTHSLPSIRHSRNPYGPETQPAEITLISCRTRVRLLGQLHSNFRGIWNHRNTSSPRILQFADVGRRSFSFLQTSLQDPHHRPVATVDLCPDWQASIARFTVGTSPQPQGILICGPKASGKSTFARLLCNTILTRPATTGSFDGLILLDIDPGQPEFSPPGEISLLHLRSCVFSPPFTHPVPSTQAGDRLVKAHHIGTVSPKDDPDHYLHCIIDLLNHYQQTLSSYPSCPLIVNCSGWVGGGGLEILAELLRSPILTDVVYMSKTGPEEIFDVLERAAQRARISFHKLTSQPSQNATRTAADLRRMQSLSYFHLDEPDKNGLRWDPSILSFRQLLALPYAGTEQVVFGIMVPGDELDMKCLFDLIDGSVLGAVAIEDDSVLAVPSVASGGLRENSNSCNVLSELEMNNDGDGVSYALPRNKDCEVQCSGELMRLSRSESDYSEARGTILCSGPDHPWVRRTEEQLPYLFNGLEANIPLDPAKTRSLGQVLVRGIDRESRVLHVATPIPRSVIDGLRGAGIRIVLVRGRSDLPEWSYTEEYNTAVSGRTRKKARGSVSQVNADDNVGSEDSGYSDVEFDMEDWAKNVDWVTTDQSSKGKQRKDKVWKVRRNLRNRRSGGGNRSE